MPSGPSDPGAGIPVDSIEEEYAAVGQLRCQCGGGYKITLQALLLNPPRDAITLTCRTCAATRDLVFDISAFYQESV